MGKSSDTANDSYKDVDEKVKEQGEFQQLKADQVGEIDEPEELFGFMMPKDENPRPAVVKDKAPAKPLQKDAEKADRQQEPADLKIGKKDKVDANKGVFKEAEQEKDAGTEKPDSTDFPKLSLELPQVPPLSQKRDGSGTTAGPETAKAGDPDLSMSKFWSSKPDKENPQSESKPSEGLEQGDQWLKEKKEAGTEKYKPETPEAKAREFYKNWWSDEGRRKLRETMVEMGPDERVRFANALKQLDERERGGTGEFEVKMTEDGKDVESIRLKHEPQQAIFEQTDVKRAEQKQKAKEAEEAAEEAAKRASESNSEKAERLFNGITSSNREESEQARKELAEEMRKRTPEDRLKLAQELEECQAWMKTKPLNIEYSPGQKDVSSIKHRLEGGIYRNERASEIDDLLSLAEHGKRQKLQKELYKLDPADRVRTVREMEARSQERHEKDSQVPVFKAHYKPGNQDVLDIEITGADGKSSPIYEAPQGGKCYKVEYLPNGKEIWLRADGADLVTRDSKGRQIDRTRMRRGESGWYAAGNFRFAGSVFRRMYLGDDGQWILTQPAQPRKDGVESIVFNNDLRKGYDKNGEPTPGLFTKGGGKVTVFKEGEHEAGFRGAMELGGLILGPELLALKSSAAARAAAGGARAVGAGMRGEAAAALAAREIIGGLDKADNLKSALEVLVQMFGRERER